MRACGLGGHSATEAQPVSRGQVPLPPMHTQGSGSTAPPAQRCWWVTTGAAELPWSQRCQESRPVRGTSPAQEVGTPLVGYSAQRQMQRASEAPGIQAEGAAAYDLRSSIWQEGSPGCTPVTRELMSLAKPGAPVGAGSATEARLAAAPQAGPLPHPGQGRDPSSSAALGTKKRLAAPSPVHGGPVGLASVPPLILRPRSACSPVAAAMQSPKDTAPPPAWGDTF